MRSRSVFRSNSQNGKLSLLFLGMVLIIGLIITQGVYAHAWHKEDDDSVVASEVLFSDTAIGSYLAARMARTHKDFSLAAIYYDSLLAFTPDNIDFIEQALVANLAAGNMARAFELADELKRNHSDNAIAAIALAANYMSRKRFTSVQRQLKNNNKGNFVVNVTSNMLQAWALAAKGQVSKSIKQLDKTFFFNNHMLSDFHKGLIYAVSGNNRQAIARLKSVYEFNKADRYAEAYARQLARSGKIKQALNVVSQINAADLRVFLSDLIKKRRDHIKPLVSSYRQGAAELFINIADIVSSSNGGKGGNEINELSVVYYNIAHRLDGDNVFPILRLANVAILREDYSYADQLLASKTLANSRYNKIARFERAVNMIRADKPDKAKERLKKLIAKYPDYVDAIILMVQIERDEKRYNKAIEHLNAALALNKPAIKPQLLFERAITYEADKKHDKAIADARSALKLDPNNANILNYIGYYWADNNKNLDKATVMIKKALAIKPYEPSYLDSLGWVYYRYGQYEKAAGYIEKALQFMPKQPVINDHLGDIYWRTGYTVQAIYQWRKVLKFDPDPDLAVRVKNKLTNGLSDDSDAAAISRY